MTWGVHLTISHLSHTVEYQHPDQQLLQTEDRRFLSTGGWLSRRGLVLLANAHGHRPSCLLWRCPAGFLCAWHWWPQMVATSLSIRKGGKARRSRGSQCSPLLSYTALMGFVETTISKLPYCLLLLDFTLLRGIFDPTAVWFCDDSWQSTTFLLSASVPTYVCCSQIYDVNYPVNQIVLSA